LGVGLELQRLTIHIRSTRHPNIPMLMG